MLEVGTALGGILLTVQRLAVVVVELVVWERQRPEPNRIIGQRQRIPSNRKNIVQRDAANQQGILWDK